MPPRGTKQSIPTDSGVKQQAVEKARVQRRIEKGLKKKHGGEMWVTINGKSRKVG